MDDTFDMFYLYFILSLLCGEINTSEKSKTPELEYKSNLPSIAPFYAAVAVSQVDAKICW